MKKLFSVRTIILVGSLLLQLSLLCFTSHGAAGNVDLSFDPGSGVNGPVRAVAVQPDGKTIIGGQFTTANGLLRTNLARLNADGSGDATFNPAIAYNAYSFVTSLALQSDGKVLVGNEVPDTICDEFGCYPFTELHVTRLNTDGSLDASFNPSTGIGNYSNVGGSSLVVQTNGKVLICGGFYTVNGTNRNHIARLNANGTLDTSFSPGTGVGGSYVGVNSVAIQADSKVLVGGLFETFNGTNRNNIARLNDDGSLDSSFDPGTGVNAAVLSVATQADGKVLIGGDFATVSGTNRGIARLNGDGSLDSTFNPGTGLGGYSPRVSSVAVQTDGKVFIGGYFTAVNGTNRNRIARLNGNGSLDTSFDPGTGANGGIATVALQPGGRVLIVGYFTTVNGTNRNRMARLNADGSLDGDFDPGRGIESSFSSLVVQPDGKVIVGIIRLNADGSLDPTYVPTNSPSFPADLSFPGSDYSIATCGAVQSDGKRLIGGYFDSTYVDPIEGGVTQWRSYFLSRFNADASRDTNFVQVIGYPDYGMTDTAVAVAVEPDGKVLFASRYGFKRLNSNGTPDASFNASIGGVSSLLLQADGRIFIAGSFGTVNGTSRGGIARLNANGSLDNTFNPGTGANGNVTVFVLQPDGKVLIGGEFTTFNGTNRNRISRLNADGSLDLSFDPGAGADASVSAITLQPDGNILIGGDFLTVNGVLRPYVARLYGDSVVLPSLNIVRSNAFVIVSWPSSATGFLLQQNADLTGTNWTTPSETVSDNGTIKSISASPVSGHRYFRLSKP